MLQQVWFFPTRLKIMKWVDAVQQTLLTGILLTLIWLASFVFSHQVTAKTNNDNWFNQVTPIKALKNTDFFKLNKSSQSINNKQSQLAGYLNFKVMIGSEYFKLLRNNYDLNVVGDGGENVKILPEINFEFVQDLDDLISNKRTIQRSNHSYWEWLIMPGKISDPFTKTGFSKVVFPFALQEKNADCTHNGYLSFLIKANGEVSNGYYQISSETCAYFQFDLAGRIKVEFSASNNIGQNKLVDEYRKELATNQPAFSKVELNNDYPKLNVEKLLPHKNEHSTTSGLVINNKHYRLNCDTRNGEHVDCEQLALPSYSTAKSIFAGIALMRLEKKVKNIRNILVAKVIPECEADKWKGVTLNDLLNMRTGNYLNKKYHSDEGSKRMVDFFLSEKSTSKISMACNMFPRRSTPGKFFVYHSSDTFLAGVMMERLYERFTGKKNIYYNFLANDLWLKLNLSPLLQGSKRTYDNENQPFTGWGLTYVVDDIIKLVQFLEQEININSESKALDETMLASAMQTSRSAINRSGGLKGLAYNNGFWGLEVSSKLDCKKPKWVPFMSGYGGITVAMISPDILYYNFSDNNQFKWLNILIELNKQFPLCEVIS
jgi:hypothetical protein